MNNSYLKIDEWSIIQDKLDLENNRFYESIMSLANGYMGIRGNFEEDFSGSSLRGTYIAGIYYPDKTKVGWWKIGYPEYFAKVLNSTNFIGIRVKINGDFLDLAKTNIIAFKNTLNMKEGLLLREFTIKDDNGSETSFNVKRFLSMAKNEIAAIEYSITPKNHNAKIELIPYIDGNIHNEDSNYDEEFWIEINTSSKEGYFHVTQKTLKTNFSLCCASTYSVLLDDKPICFSSEVIKSPKYAANKIYIDTKEGSTLTLYKYIAVTNTRYFAEDELVQRAYELLAYAKHEGFYSLFDAHTLKWSNIWQNSDIIIDGDTSSQQAIRFNIFQLNQTYTGNDDRLNIGPKGFTGEKYGGSTYWDTEAYCIPFYLGTSDEKISKNLLLYRYKQLDKAKENSRKLGLKGALYPMVTMNGEECHNEWEITFEEIHRNAAIAYAIFNYVRYTGDESYLYEYGFSVLVETSRFWESRVTYNPFKKAYMILGVTGPNEYENNVNNNWYTNKMASWNLEYTLQVAKILKDKYNNQYKLNIKKLNLTASEIEKWQHIVDNMYYPYDKETGLFIQQDGYFDKEQLLVCDIPKYELPINKHWSWDKILRSCFIKQADVLQGIFNFYDIFDNNTKKVNFDFYEPKTVHESSLSPCIHCIIAAELDYRKKAYELYLKSSRLDLNNVNNDTEDGLHITSMAGAWMSIVYGFGGFRILNNMISLKPIIIDEWNSYSFKILFRKNLLNIQVTKDCINVLLEKGDALEINIWNENYLLKNAILKNVILKNCIL